MLRRIRWTIDVVLIGVILNVGVAWAIVLLHGDVAFKNTSSTFFHDDQGQGLIFSSLFGYRDLSIYYAVRGDEWFSGGFRNEPAIPLYRGAQWWLMTEPPRPSLVVHAARGWPAKSLYAAIVIDHSNEEQLLPDRRIEWGWAGDRWNPNWNLPAMLPRVFPYRPLWIGFGLNTLFYAALVGLLWGGRIMLRRWYRQRQGRCIACGYPRGTSPVCTECGEVPA